MTRLHLRNSNAHYENNFGVSSAFGAGNTKIVFFESPPNMGFQKNNFYNEHCCLRKKQKRVRLADSFLFNMPGTRFELVTRGFSVHCSTN